MTSDSITRTRNQDEIIVAGDKSLDPQSRPLEADHLGLAAEALFEDFIHRHSGEAAARIFAGAIVGPGPFTCEGYFPKDDPRSNDKTLYARSVTGRFDDCFGVLVDWQNEGRNVYMRVNEGGPTKAAITRIRTISLDFDAPEPHHQQFQELPGSWHVLPSLIVRRSNSVHAHWLVSDCSVEEADALQRRLQRFYGSDPNTVGRQRVWRVPGFRHPAFPSQQVELYVSNAAWNQAKYSCAELETGLPIEPDNTQLPPTVKPSQRGVAPAQLRDMLTYINPEFNGAAPANFDRKKFGGQFGWGMNEWAGIARMVWSGEIPLVGDDADVIDWHELTFDWSSGDLWKERTDETLSTSCPGTQDALEIRLAGAPVGNGYTVATIIKLARACGYDGPIGIEGSEDFAIGSDIEIAKRLISDFEKHYASDVIHAEGEFYVFDGARWTAIDESDLRRRVHGYDGKNYGDHGTIRLGRSRVDSILNEAAAIAERAGFFDDAAKGINCKNGFIFFGANGMPSLEPHKREHRARHVISGNWVPDLGLWWEGELLSKLLLGCFRDDGDRAQRIDLIAEVCGAVAMGLAPWTLKQPKAFVFFGKHANNGKSQILDMIRGLVPKEAVTSISPAHFDIDAYRLKLQGKLLNTASELGTAKTISAELFKSVVTGDVMTVNKKYRPAVDFRSRAVHLFATNVLPPFQGGMDRGVRRRLCAVEFNRVFEPQEMVEGIGQRVALEEVDALLALAVAGASRLLARGEYTEPPSCAAALQDWVVASDPVVAWVECRTECVKGQNVRQHDLLSDFNRWALREGYDQQHLPKINNFIARITAHVSGLSTHRLGKGGKDGRVLRGLKLLADEGS